MIELKVHEFNDKGRQKAHELAAMLEAFEGKVGTMTPRFVGPLSAGAHNGDGARARALVHTKLEEVFHRALEAIATDPENMVAPDKDGAVIGEEEEPL